MKLKAFILTLIISGSLFAQNGSVGSADAYTTAFGKTYTIISRGVYALGFNPANIALSEAGHFEFTTLPNLNGRFGTDFVSINEINYFFGGTTNASGEKVGKYLDANDKERMRKLFADGGTIFVDFAWTDLAFTYKISDAVGSIGFAVQDNFSTKLKLPSGIVDLALNGNPVGKEYNLNDFKFKAGAIRTISFAYAREFNNAFPKLFKQLSAGVTIKSVIGYAYAGLERINTTFVTNSDRSITERGDLMLRSSVSPDLGIEYDFDTTGVDKPFAFSLFPKPAGSGLGLDFGISAIVNDKWSFGIAVTDIGKMKWTENIAEYSSTSEFTLTDISDPAQRDSLAKSFKGEGKPGEAFETDLPTAFRFGAAYVFKPDVFMLSLDLNIGLTDVARNEKGTRVSLGGEWNPLSWLPYLRGGFSFGGSDVFSWTVGIGLNIGPFEFNAATPDFQYIFTPKDGKRVSFAGSWRLKF